MWNLKKQTTRLLEEIRSVVSRGRGWNWRKVSKDINFLV